MTSTELRKQVEQLLDIVHELGEEGTPDWDGDTGNRGEVVHDMLNIIQEAQLEAIGEDEHAYNLTNKKHRTCPYCGVDEGAYHHDGCESLFESIRNYLRAEQRKKL